MRKNILILCAITVLGCAVIFPEAILLGKTSWLMFNDHLVDYVATFILTGFFYQGGIQLWDFFGQMPHTYHFATFGMFKMTDVLTALVYVIFSPLSNNSAQFFHQTFSFVFVVSLLLINAIGMFLLLTRFTSNPWVRTIGSAIFALLFSVYAFSTGMLCMNIFPLFMYLTLSFFETFHSRYLVMGIVLMVISLQQGFIHTFYTYLALNFFLISCLVWSFIDHGALAVGWAKGIVKDRRKYLKLGLCVLGFAVVVLAPYAYMLAFCLKDFMLDLGHSRIVNIWDANQYFNVLALSLGDTKRYFSGMLDFTFEPGGATYFVGYMMFFLSALGLALSKDSRKWVFVAAILLVWFINFPRHDSMIGFLAHWLNVLTNPVKSLARGYSSTTGYAVFFLMPLAVLGITALLELCGGKVGAFARWRAVWASVGITVFILMSLAVEPPAVQLYLLISLAVSLLTLAILVYGEGFPRYVRHGAIGALALLVVMDMCLSAYQTKTHLSSYCTVRPHQIGFLGKPGFVNIDHQNPKILPFVLRHDFFPSHEDPVLWSFYDISPTFIRVINRQLALTPLEDHRPRHVSFASWVDRPVMQKYMTENDRLFFFARYAVRDRPGVLEEIVGRGLSRDVVALEASGAGVLADVPDVQAKSHPEEEWVPTVVEFKDYGQKFTFTGNMMIWQFPLSRPLPRHAATTVFSKDKSLRFFIQGPEQKPMELEPAQGALISPWTFDAQNIKEGKVFVALPMDHMFANGTKGILLVRGAGEEGVTCVWKHTSDETGFNYKVPQEGWLVIQYPYDPKWRITIDGRGVRFYRVNGSFMGVPITPGEHKVRIQYWPGSWLRWGLFLSAFAATAGFICLIAYALRKESKAI